jgi:hypothetical protein
MKAIPGLISAPFSTDEVKSINRYQSDGGTSPMVCDECGGKYYAREDGLTCGKCYAVITQIPKFTTNWSWSKFKQQVKEKSNGVS